MLPSSCSLPGQGSTGPHGLPGPALGVLRLHDERPSSHHDEHHPGPQLQNLRTGDDHVHPDLVSAVAKVTALQDWV